MKAEVEVLVLRERVRGLELAVELLRERTEPAQPGRLGFKVLGNAALATAESDDDSVPPVAIVPTQKITWFGTKPASIDQPVTISEA
jgi:hypothetical protein